jgi:hypothetical protein
MKLRWTTHGAIQLTERTSWSPEDVQKLLDEGKTVCVGIDKGKQLRGNRRGGRRVHSLAYDERSHDWFVVVWDEETGEVVTVLSLEFHNRCAWRVAEGALKVAKDKVVPDPHNPPPKEDPPKVGPPPPKYRVTAMVRVTPTFTQAAFIGRFDVVPPVAVVREKLKERSLDHLEIGCVVLKQGKRSDPVAYTVRDDQYVSSTSWNTDVAKKMGQI